VKNEKGHVPLRYWVLWWSLIVVADFVFYVLLTPIWMGLRIGGVGGVRGAALPRHRTRIERDPPRGRS
jgi:hypothetical protein